MNNFNDDVFLSDLEINLATSLDLREEDPERLWNEFENIYNSTVYKHAPIKTRTLKKKSFLPKPWITKGIKISISNKNMMTKLLVRNKGEISKEFKKYRNILSRVITRSKKNYYNEQMISSNGNSKQMWKNINEIITLKRRSQNSIDHILDSDNKEIKDPKHISNLLNHNFASTAENLLKNSQRKTTSDVSSNISINKKHQNSFFLRPITKTEMNNIINKLNPKKSTKSDIPSIKFIKLSKTIIVPYLILIFNKCIESNVFPKSLKIAEVVPIYKDGKKNLCNNYRPISLLSPFAKIFENHIYNQLNQYFKKYNILYKLQYGFRQNSSTEMAVSNLCDEISNSFDKKMINCTVFMDFSKAFNTIDPFILLRKLELNGVRGAPLKLLESYLTNRFQYTKVNDVTSGLNPVKMGASQGSRYMVKNTC